MNIRAALCILFISALNACTAGADPDAEAYQDFFPAVERARVQACNASARHTRRAVPAAVRRLIKSMLLAGAPGEGSSSSGINADQADNSAWEAGAAFLFVRSATGWRSPVVVT
jgi:hypothetical protein